MKRARRDRSSAPADLLEELWRVRLRLSRFDVRCRRSEMQQPNDDIRTWLEDARRVSAGVGERLTAVVERGTETFVELGLMDDDQSRRARSQITAKLDAKVRTSKVKRAQ